MSRCETTRPCTWILYSIRLIPQSWNVKPALAILRDAPSALSPARMRWWTWLTRANQTAMLPLPVSVFFSLSATETDSHMLAQTAYLPRDQSICQHLHYLTLYKNNKARQPHTLIARDFVRKYHVCFLFFLFTWYNPFISCHLAWTLLESVYVSLWYRVWGNVMIHP